ncbi:MAG: hypothetical protein H0U71_04805 [Gammaproteobacteria bacterium]|nr:hypothetical protein [Gammaproteobacteria bacterium]
MLEDIISASNVNLSKFFKQDPQTQRELKNAAKAGDPEAQIIRAAREFQHGKIKMSEKLLRKVVEQNPEYENIADQIRKGDMSADDVKKALKQTQRLVM